VGDIPHRKTNRKNLGESKGIPKNGGKAQWTSGEAGKKGKPVSEARKKKGTKYWARRFWGKMGQGWKRLCTIGAVGQNARGSKIHIGLRAIEEGPAAL